MTKQREPQTGEAVGPRLELPVGRLVPERDDEAVRLAHKMAKAAGPQKAMVMARAAYMLVCCAAMTQDPEGYFDWLEKQR